MATATYIAKQAIEDELESQINAAKAELEVMTSRAQDRMAATEVDAYESLSPKLQAIQQKLLQLKNSTGAQWKQTRTDLEMLITDFKESVKETATAAQSD